MRPNAHRLTGLDNVYACAFTQLPMGEEDAKFVAKDCKKLLRLVESPVPPKSATRLSKLVCKLPSAVEVEPVESLELLVLELLVPVVPPVSEAMRLCTSATSPVAGFELVFDTELTLESESEVLESEAEVLELD